MARIKIKDLPKNAKISRDELKYIQGGVMIKSPKAIPVFRGDDDDCEPEVEYFFAPSEVGDCD